MRCNGQVPIVFEYPTGKGGVPLDAIDMIAFCPQRAVLARGGAGNRKGHMQDETGSDDFWLYDLRVETVIGDRTAVCRHVEGESFRVEGELLIFDKGQKVSMYALAALLPLLPVKQRLTSPNDWISTDAEVDCPDPNCGGRFRIVRGSKRRFSHAETTGLPDARDTPYWQKPENKT